MDGTYRRLVPLTTISTLRLPQPAQTSRAFQSSTVVWPPNAINRTRAAAALPSVIGGPGSDFTMAPKLTRDAQIIVVW
jgi:hypothetical protein